MTDPLVAALRNVTPAQARVIWEAISQFVENGEDIEDELKEGLDYDHLCGNAEAELAKLDAAREVEKLLTAAMCSLAA